MPHPWHDIPLGDEAPVQVRVVVEVPRGETTKYELDKELGLLSVNRIMSPPVAYPANYGFLPRTLDEDGDPLDALVLMQNSVVPTSLLRARPIGIVKLIDRDLADDKLICVHVDDPMYSDYTTLHELPSYEQERLRWFFEDYKDAMQSGVEVKGFEGLEAAHETVQRCLKRYADRFEKP